MVTNVNKCKAWRTLNPEKSRASSRKWRETNVKKVLFKTAMERSEKYGITFSLMLEDITLPDVCPVFGTKFVCRTPYAASLDRIDNTRGYEPDNVQVISKLANTMKNKANQVQLKAFAQWAGRLV